MNKDRPLDLDIPSDSIPDHAAYLELFKKLGKVEIRMVEKNEECRHNLGDVFFYENPYRRPANVCSALLHVLDLYIWRAALGFPSWNSGDRKVFQIHCPDKKGTVWEMRKTGDSASDDLAR
jgi:uncharacterized repeat protein (TIGR04076 family)